MKFGIAKNAENGPMTQETRDEIESAVQRVCGILRGTPQGPNGDIRVTWDTWSLCCTGFPFGVTTVRVEMQREGSTEIRIANANTYELTGIRDALAARLRQA